ncbi:MAG: hypothetical protein Q4B85_06665 [Lachnospiraceae bacterium]|nr:hypothetical protein [Lachnospiraceae bacterium]
MKIIEEIVKEHLERHLDVPVKVKKDVSLERYCLIERTGGGEEEYIPSAVIAIQSYGSSMYDAATLNEFVKAAMKKLISNNAIALSELNSDYHYPDLEIKKERYQAVYNIKYYQED